MADRFRPQAYARPRNLAEALEVFERFGLAARVIAGGTDLLIRKPRGIRCLLDVAGLGLAYIRESAGVLQIGAATSARVLAEHPRLAVDSWQVLAEAAGCLATSTIRNTATIGGNLCNASPAADLPLALMALQASLVAVGPDGEREIPIESFFKDVNQTALKANELLTEIRIPAAPRNAGAAFIKLRRQQTAIDIAVVNVATFLAVQDGCCTTARIAMGAVAPTPVYAPKAQALLLGAKVDEKLMQRVGEAAAEESRPIDDLRASATYRRRMLAVLVQRSLTTSLRRCNGWPK
jgi:carbon-monoxide dehydrogenase medium subunit